MQNDMNLHKNVLNKGAPILSSYRQIFNSKILRFLASIFLIFGLSSSLFAANDDEFVRGTILKTTEGVTVKDGATVPNNTKFLLTYQVKPTRDLQAGYVAKFSIPSTLKAPTQGNRDMVSDGKTVASISFSPNEVTMKFTQPTSEFSIFTVTFNVDFATNPTNGSIVTMALPNRTIKVLIGQSSAVEGDKGPDAKGTFSYNIVTAGQVQDDPATGKQVVAYQAQITNLVNNTNNIQVIKAMNFSFDLTGYSGYSYNQTTKNGAYLRIEGFANNKRVVDENIQSKDYFTSTSGKITVDGKKVIDTLLAKDKNVDALRFTIYILPNPATNGKDYSIKFSSTVTYNNNLSHTEAGVCEFRWIEKPPTFTGNYLQVNVLYRTYNSKGEIFSEDCRPTTIDMYDKGIRKTSLGLGDIDKNYGCSAISLYNEYEDGDAEQASIAEGFHNADVNGKTVSYNEQSKTKIITFLNVRTLEEDDEEDLEPCPVIKYKLKVNVNWFVDGQKVDCNNYKDLSHIKIYDVKSVTQEERDTACGFEMEPDQVMTAYQSNTPPGVKKTTWKQDIDVNKTMDGLEDTITTTVTVDIDNYMGEYAGDIVLQVLWWKGHVPDPNNPADATMQPEDCTKYTSVVGLTEKTVFGDTQPIPKAAMQCRKAISFDTGKFDNRTFVANQTDLPSGWTHENTTYKIGDEGTLYVTLNNVAKGPIVNTYEKILLNVDVTWEDENGNVLASKSKPANCKNYSSTFTEVFYGMFNKISSAPNCGFSKDLSEFNANGDDMGKFIGLSEEDITQGFSFFDSKKTVIEDKPNKTLTINYSVINKKIETPKDVIANFIRVRFQTVDENGTPISTNKYGLPDDDPCGPDILETTANIKGYKLLTGQALDPNAWCYGTFSNFTYSNSGGWYGFSILVHRMSSSHPRYREFFGSGNETGCKTATETFCSTGSGGGPMQEPILYTISPTEDAIKAGYTLKSAERITAPTGWKLGPGRYANGLFYLFVFERRGVPNNQEVDRVKIKWWVKSLDGGDNKEETCDDSKEVKLDATLLQGKDAAGKDVTEKVSKSISCSYDPGFKLRDVNQTIITPDYVQLSQQIITEDDGSKTLIFNNIKEVKSKPLKINVEWYLQTNKYRPAVKLNCQDYDSAIDVFDMDLSNITPQNTLDITCSAIIPGLKTPDANQILYKLPDNFNEKSKSPLTETDSYFEITFKNQKCLSATDENGDCEVEDMPPYIGVPGIVNPTYPTGPSTIQPIKPINPSVPGGGTYPGKPGKPTVNPSEPYNPIFVPPAPTTKTNIPTQVSGKPFVPVFVDPNIKVNKVPEDTPGKDWGYEIEYCNPYSTTCETLPIDDDGDFQKWLGGHFEVYLLDALINPNYVAQCQSQNSKPNDDLELGTTLPFYFEGADKKYNSNKALKDHAPYKSYGLSFSLGLGNGNNPYMKMNGVRIPDAHQKLSFMLQFIPNPNNTAIKQYNICNSDTFALRPAFFISQTNNSINNIKVSGGDYSVTIKKPRIVSSYTSNLDIQRQIFYPSDEKAEGVPNYTAELGFYSNNGNINKQNLIKVDSAVVEANTASEPYIAVASYSCDFNKNDICSKGDCVINPNSRSAARSRALGRSLDESTGKVIWTNKPMLIKAEFAYFNDGVPLNITNTHTKIKAIRKKLAYFPGTKPTSTYYTDENNKDYKGRSMISTHLKGADKVFLYNNIGDMNLVLIDNRWTIYDQSKKDSVGRTRDPKCVLENSSNTPNSSALVGCNVGMAAPTSFKYVPDFIEVTPEKVIDKFDQNDKTFTYFSNKHQALSADKDVAAKLQLDATAYASSEVYTVKNKFGKLDYPLIAYGYESGGANSCGKSVDMTLNYVFDCADPSLDIRVSDYLPKRCGNLAMDLNKDCANYPFDSRCYLINQSNHPKITNLKDTFRIFNAKALSGADANKVSVKDFKKGSATTRDVYFNFIRTKNYPTNPKIININDFYAKNIVEEGFNGSSKDYVPAITNSTVAQTNKFSTLTTDQANNNNAHFYYGYVNSAAKNYLLCEKGSTYNCDGKNNVGVNILVYSQKAICNTNSGLCSSASPFLGVFKEANYKTDRKMYTNIYDNFDSSNIDTFANKYITRHFSLVPTKRASSTTKGVENIEFEKFPSNFNEDIAEVYTSDYFVYSDDRGVIKEDIPYNTFRLLYHPDQGNTWGGEGSTKTDNFDKVGNVPMGQDLLDTSKNLNRRLR